MQEAHTPNHLLPGLMMSLFTTIKKRIDMKKILLMIPAMLMAVGMQAQTVLTIGTKKGSSYTYTVGTDADSIRVIEGTGIKVYPKNSKESVDFLMSQISYTIVQKNNKTNTNRNTEEDLKKN